MKTLVILPYDRDNLKNAIGGFSKYLNETGQDVDIYSTHIAAIMNAKDRNTILHYSFAMALQQEFPDEDQIVFGFSNRHNNFDEIVVYRRDTCIAQDIAILEPMIESASKASLLPKTTLDQLIYTQKDAERCFDDAKELFKYLASRHNIQPEGSN